MMKKFCKSFRLGSFELMCLITLWLFIFYFKGYYGFKDQNGHYFIQRSPQDMKGPSFIYEPPNKVEFSNITGTVIVCKASGSPLPTIKWETENGELINDVPNLRRIRADGSLVITPFRAQDYRPDIHSSVYFCIASNKYGTIASRDVHLKGVVIQSFVIEVYDEYIVTGNTASFKCNIPSFVKDYLTIIEWIEEPTGRVIKPTATFATKLSNSKDNRYFMLQSGELYIKQVDVSLNHRSYKCKAKHRLTEKIFISSSSGKLIITESHSVISPRISHITPIINSVEKVNIALPCAAQGYPLPSYNWYKKGFNQPTFLSFNKDRSILINGILIIQNVNIQDNGVYMCHVNNSAGEEKAETKLIVRAPLSAKLIPSHEVIEVGNSLLFNCSVIGSPIDSIVWKKNNKIINVDSDESGIRFLAKDLLHLESIRKHHRGMYQCFVYNQYESVQASAQLMIGDEPPELRETFESQILEPGPSLSLKCVAAGNPLPQITWTLDGFAVPENLGVRFGDFVTKEGLVVSYVNISEVKIEDGGKYECKADNGAAVVYYSNRINVIGPPFVRPMKNITVVAGEILRIACPASGYPIDELIWEKAGQRLPFNHKQKVYDNGTLEVHQVEKSIDEGLYTCVAKNKKAQSARSSLYVNIRIRPFIEPFMFPKSLREGQRASVLCTVSSGDYPIQLKWLKDNLPVIQFSGIKVNQISHYSSTLLFESLGLEHKGNYTCIASNEAGTVSHTAYMIIHVPPRWIIEPTDNSVIRGKSLSVDCQAEGFPIPRIRWTKAEGNTPRNFKPIVSSPHLQIYENGSLTIQEARNSDSGYYLCQASNNVGSGPSKVIKVTVNVASHFKSKFSAEMVQKGNSVRIKCEAFGDKPISITWTKDKQKIYFGNEKNFNQVPNYILKENNYEVVETLTNFGLISEILIDKAARTDSALFTCLASNAFGYDDTNIQLIVQEAPDSPHDIQIVEIGSRKVKLSWSPPYSGNSPITFYYILYKSAFYGNGNFENISISSESETFGTVNNLKPAQMYFFKMMAENRIGKSESSKTLEIMTEEEPPESPPLNVQAQAIDSKSIKVTWKEPQKKYQNGAINGYYIGYKPVLMNGQSSSFIYKTIQIDKNFKEEAIIRGLKRYTKYEVIVQAFNNKGASPFSEEVFVQTFEMDVPITPQIHITSTSAHSINLSWEPVTGDSNTIDGYYLYQRAHSKDFKLSDSWKEVHLKNHQTFYMALNLPCGTRHQFYLVAYNKIGKGQESDIVTVKTDGSVPVAPFHKSILTTNITSAIVHLSAWHDGGCPITSYSIKYRLNSKNEDQEWKEVAFDRSKPSDVEITGLIPMKSYQLLVTAENQVGLINAEYSFSSMLKNFPDLEVRSNFKVNGRTTNRALTSSISLQLTDYSIIFSIVASILVLIVITFLICIVYRKLQFSSSTTGTESLYSSTNGIKLNPNDSNTLPLQMLPPKVFRSYEGISTLPKMNCDTLRKNKSLNQGNDAEPLYATVKRAPRVPKADPHIYSYPLTASPLISRLNANRDPTASTSDTVNICNCEIKETETKLVDHGLCPLILDKL